MKNNQLVIIYLFSLFTLVFVTFGCSKNDNDPEDYYQSLLSGEYGKGKYWTLNTILNGDTIKTDGFVRFDSKDLTEGDFRFVDVIPGESYKEFKNVDLSASDEGVAFSIEYTRKADNVYITGIVSFGEMTVDMTLSE